MMHLLPEDYKSLTTFFRKRGRLPVTKEQVDLEKRRSIRELVFGLQDGVLSTLGFIVGMQASGLDPFYGSLIAAFSGMISMGVGEYLGSKAETHVVASVIAEEKQRIETEPEKEFLETIDFLMQKGFQENEARTYTRILVQNPDVWLGEALRDEYGVQPSEANPSGAIKSGIVMGLAFFLGDLIPTLAWGFTHNIFWVFLSAACCLGLVGIVAGKVSRQNPIIKASELICAGGLLFGFTDFVCSYISHIIK